MMSIRLVVISVCWCDIHNVNYQSQSSVMSIRLVVISVCWYDIHNVNYQSQS